MNLDIVREVVATGGKKRCSVRPRGHLTRIHNGAVIRSRAHDRGRLGDMALQHECWVAAQACPTISAQYNLEKKRNQEESSEQELEILYGRCSSSRSTKRDYQLRGLIGGPSDGGRAPGSSGWVGWEGTTSITTTAKALLEKESDPVLAPPRPDTQSPLRTLFRHGGNDVEAHVGPFGLAGWPTGRRGHALLFGNSPAARRGRAHNRWVGCSLLPLACRFLLILTLTGDRWKEGLDRGYVELGRGGGGGAVADGI